MITRLIVGNFKAIGEPVEIELRPITLLFGPNAAGKSSILQAVDCAIEILEGRTADTRHTRLGGEHLDLGGFANLVHGRDTSKSITLGFEQRFEREIEEGMPAYLQSPFDVATTQTACGIRDAIRSHRIVWQVSSVSDVGAEAYEVELNDEPIASLDNRKRHPGLSASCRMLRLRCDHPLLETAKFDAETSYRTLPELILGATGDPCVLIDGWAEIPLWSQDGALPLTEDSVSVADAARAFERRTTFEAASGVETARSLLNDILDAVLVEPMAQLAGDLRRALHVGPMRAIPPRDSGFIAAPKAPAAGNREYERSWYDGTVAWRWAGRYLYRVPGDDVMAELGQRTTRDDVDWVNNFLHLNFLMDTNMRLQVVRHRYFADNRDEVQFAEETNDFADDGEERVDVPPLGEFVSLMGDESQLRSRSKQKLLELLQRIREESAKLPCEDRLVLRDQVRGISLTLQDVGTGISQVIPVLMAILNTSVHMLRIVEQPELHLHPRAQCALGDALIAGAARMHWREVALVETHSEHLLLRLLRRIRETSQGKLDEYQIDQLLPEQLSVVYVEPSPNGAQVRRLRVDERGEFIDRWPNGFFEERGEELFS